LKTARSSGATMNDGISPRVALWSSELISTIGRSTSTISEAPITSRSAGMRGPSAMRRRMRPA
jgi:hypothetical protein